MIGATPELIEKGIPDEAFSPVDGDDRKVAKEIKSKNKKEKKQQTLGEFGLEKEPTWAYEYAKLSHTEEDDVDSVKWKQECYRAIVESPKRQHEKLVADTWCGAFFWQLNGDAPPPPTEATLRTMQKGMADGCVDPDTKSRILELAEEHRFFHWHLEFPDVFEGDEGGFDCVLGNPPWDVLQAEEKPWFIVRDEKIGLATGSGRKMIIKELGKANPDLYKGWISYKKSVDNCNLFLKHSGRFTLTAKGKLNYYPLFAEHDKQIINGGGSVGMVIASGIATDFYNQNFFQNVVGNGQLASLYDFENREKIFSEIHSSYKFSLLTLTGKEAPVQDADFAFYLTNPDHIQEEDRHFTLTNEEIELLNPNTKTCPIFRSKKDAELTKKIYRKHPVLIKENPDGKDENPWGISFKQGLFNMTSDSELFKSKDQLTGMGFELDGNIFRRGEETYLPLYEGKMIWSYDHRFAGFSPEAKGYGTAEATTEQHQDPDWEPMPRYWVREEEVKNRVGGDVGWFLGFRDITNTTNERTAIFSIFERTGVSNKMPILLQEENRLKQELVFLCTIFSSCVFDYIARQCIGGTSMNFYLIKQFALPLPSIFLKAGVETIIRKNFLKLFYTSHALTSFAHDLGYDGLPFKWDLEERAHLMAELDAIVAHLYGVTRDELDYILETFPIVKRKDIAKYGEYRTKRIILEYYNNYKDILEATK